MEFWIARDKPTRDRGRDYYSTNTEYYLQIDHDLFPEVTFENSPQKVELKLVNNDTRR